MSRSVLLKLCFGCMYVVFICSLSFQSFAYESHSIDTFGFTEQESKLFLEQYAKQLSPLLESLSNYQKKYGMEAYKKPEFVEVYMKIDALKAEIKQKMHLLFISVDTIEYGPKTYTTVSVVKPDAPHRMHFVNASDTQEYVNRHDVIDKMHEFEQLAFARLLEGKAIIVTKEDCPVFHCFIKFDDAVTKPYLTIFNEAAAKQKSIIEKTIAQDENPLRRTSAIYLTGHYQDPKQIIHLLAPYVSDSNEDVRNATMRVLSNVFLDTDVASLKIDPKPYMALLDSPISSDRNKALGVLTQLVKDPSIKKYVIQKGKEPLLALYSMKQPNQADSAYVILKEISGKDFGAHNRAGWEQWFNLHSGVKSDTNLTSTRFPFNHNAGLKA